MLYRIINDKYSVFFFFFAYVCQLWWWWWWGVQVEGLVGKEDGAKTVIAASKRGLHGFPCHHVPAIMGLHYVHQPHSTFLGAE